MKSVLIIDDDAAFRETLSEALTDRGFEVRHAANGPEALAIAKSFGPEGVVLDLRIGRESGLKLIAPLLEIDPFTRIVVLTGFANLATAIEAIKLGAVHYLAKPAGLKEIIAAFGRGPGDDAVPIDTPAQSALEAERDHMRAALARNNGNISAAARELRMHRRTLQRKLEKRV